MKKQDAVKRRKSINIFYKSTFTSETGRYVLADLVRRYMMPSSYVPGDAYGTHFNEGARSVITSILYEMRIDPDQFIKLAEEVYDD